MIAHKPSARSGEVAKSATDFFGKLLEMLNQDEDNSTCTISIYLNNSSILYPIISGDNRIASRYNYIVAVVALSCC